MPKHCCVAYCTNNNSKCPELSFFIIPSESKEPEKRKLWLRAIRREDDQGKLWEPKAAYTYLCGDHFLSGKKSLDPEDRDYVPSIFPEHEEGGGSASPDKTAKKRRLETLPDEEPAGIMGVGKRKRTSSGKDDGMGTRKRRRHNLTMDPHAKPTALKHQVLQDSYVHDVLMSISDHVVSAVPPDKPAAGDIYLYQGREQTNMLQDGYEWTEWPVPFSGQRSSDIKIMRYKCADVIDGSFLRFVYTFSDNEDYWLVHYVDLSKKDDASATPATDASTIEIETEASAIIAEANAIVTEANAVAEASNVLTEAGLAETQDTIGTGDAIVTADEAQALVAALATDVATTAATTATATVPAIDVDSEEHILLDVPAAVHQQPIVKQERNEDVDNALLKKIGPELTMDERRECGGIIPLMSHRYLDSFQAQTILTWPNKRRVSALPPYQPKPNEVYLYRASDDDAGCLDDGYVWTATPTELEAGGAIKCTRYTCDESLGASEFTRVKYTLAPHNNYVLMRYYGDEPGLYGNRTRTHKFKETGKHKEVHEKLDELIDPDDTEEDLLGCVCFMKDDFILDLEFAYSILTWPNKRRIATDVPLQPHPGEVYLLHTPGQLTYLPQDCYSWETHWCKKVPNAAPLLIKQVRSVSFKYRYTTGKFYLGCHTYRLFGKEANDYTLVHYVGRKPPEDQIQKSKLFQKVLLKLNTQPTIGVKGEDMRKIAEVIAMASNSQAKVTVVHSGATQLSTTIPPPSALNAPRTPQTQGLSGSTPAGGQMVSILARDRRELQCGQVVRDGVFNELMLETANESETVTSEDNFILMKYDRHLKFVMAHAILRWPRKINISTSPVFRPAGGDVILYDTREDQDYWKDDGYNWKNLGSRNSPWAMKFLWNIILPNDPLRNVSGFTRRAYQLHNSKDYTLVQYVGDKELADRPTTRKRSISSAKLQEDMSTEYMQVRRFTKKDMLHTVEVVKKMGDFVKCVATVPGFVCIVGMTDILDMVDKFFLHESNVPIMLSYDTTHDMGEYAVTIITVMHPDCTESSIVPVACVLHVQDFEDIFDQVLETLSGNIPELKKQPFVFMMQRNIAMHARLTDVCPQGIGVNCWAEMKRDFKKVVTGSLEEKAQSVRDLTKILECDDELQIQSVFKSVSASWSHEQFDYYMESIQHYVENYSAKYHLVACNMYTPNVGLVREKCDVWYNAISPVASRSTVQAKDFLKTFMAIQSTILNHAEDLE